MTTENIQVANGKYTVVIGPCGQLSALRYGEPWQDLTGNNLVYCLAVELREARIDGDPAAMHPLTDSTRGALHAADARKKAAAPSGFVLMPLSLTPEMEKAGGHANSEWLNDDAPIGESRYARPMASVYAAFIDAAPAKEPT